MHQRTTQLNREKRKGFKEMKGENENNAET